MIQLPRLCRLALTVCTAAMLAGGNALAAKSVPDTIAITVDAKASTTPLPHFWEQMFGSGRASLALRDDYRKDLDAVHAVTGFGYVRFHGIFDRDVGVVYRDASGKIGYNFSYVDQIYDGLLEHGVKPFVELSFMPEELSVDPGKQHEFWYHPNVMPPKDYAEWDALISAFAQHLIARYGIDEVASWYFEVWNEPNLAFWGGNPVQSTYFELYDHTVKALKSVNARLRVGGPSTAQGAWVPVFLKHVHEANVPVDFVSTHVYGDDTAQNVFHSNETISRADMVCRTVDNVHKQIAASAYPRLPLIFSEYNASYANLPNVTDSAYMGPWLANTIRECAGKVDIMSYWSFSDVFEEQGVVKTPFYGGFGLIAADRINKPAFNAFAMLHRLGDQRLPIKSDNALATLRSDGSLVLAVWNYAPPVGDGAAYTPGAPQGVSRHYTINLRHLGDNTHAIVWRLDNAHGNVIATFDQMGRPAFPTREQIAELRAAAQPGRPSELDVADGKLQLDIPPQGLVLIELH